MYHEYPDYCIMWKVNADVLDFAKGENTTGCEKKVCEISFVLALYMSWK